MAPSIDELLAAVERAPDDERVFALATDAMLEANENQGRLMAGAVTNIEKGLFEYQLGRLLEPITGLADLGLGTWQVLWRRGFIDTLSVNGDMSRQRLEAWWLNLTDFLAQPLEWLETQTERQLLRAHRLLRCLRRIEVGPLRTTASYAPLWSLLGERPLPASVRHFNADAFEELGRDKRQMTWVTLGDMRSAWPAFSRLESLRLRGSYVSFSGVSLPLAKSFEVESSSLTPQNLEQLKAAKWPRLERLSLALGDGQYNETPTTPEDVGELLKDLPPTVTHLGIRNVPYTEALLHVLAASPKLKQLTELDLSMGVLFDAAPMLMQHADAFSHLRLLEVGDTGLPRSAELTARLPALSWAKDLRHQKTARYVSVSE